MEKTDLQHLIPSELIENASSDVLQSCDERSEDRKRRCRESQQKHRKKKYDEQEALRQENIQLKKENNNLKQRLVTAEKERDYWKTEAENPFSYTPQDLEELLLDKHYDNNVLDYAMNNDQFQHQSWSDASSALAFDPAQDVLGYAEPQSDDDADSPRVKDQPGQHVEKKRRSFTDLLFTCLKGGI